VFNKTLPACEHALQYGVNLEALCFYYTHPILEIINAPDTLLGRRLMAILHRSTAGDSGAWIDGMLPEEFALFCQPTDARAQERDAILAALRARAKDIQRIQELCFLPGVLFPWCMVVMQLTEHMRTQNQVLRTHLDAVTQHLPEIAALLS